MAGAVNSSGSKSLIKIFANIFISFIGAGVLGLPFAFKEAGVTEGIIVMAFIGLISVKSMLLIIDCKYHLIEKQPHRQMRSSRSKKKVNVTDKYINNAEEDATELTDFLQKETFKTDELEEPSIPEVGPGKDLTYGDLGYYAIGTTGRILVDGAIIVSQLGFCCAYLIFIAENLSDVFHGFHIWQWLLVLLPPLFLLTLLRHLNSLAISSLLAQCSNLLAFGVVFWFDLEHIAHNEINPKEVSLLGLPFFMAVSIYCYEGAGMILALEGSVHKTARHRFRSIFKMTLTLVTLLYISFGVCGYVSFGPDTNAIITLNLPKTSSLDFAMIVKSCLCLALYFTYPVMMFPVVRILEGKCLSEPTVRWHANILRAIMVSVTGLVVLAIPNFANLMAIIGSSCCTLLAFILPGIFHLFIYKGILTKWQFSVDIGIIMMGLVGSVIGLNDAIRRLHGYTSHELRLQNMTSHYNSVTSPVFSTTNVTDTTNPTSLVNLP